MIPKICVLAIGSLSLAGEACAQPESYVELGRLDGPATIAVPVHLNFAEDIFWAHMILPDVNAERGFVDLWTRPSPFGPLDLLWPRAALFDANGQRVLQFNAPGSLNQVYGSMGQTNPHRPPNLLPEDDQICQFTFAGQRGPLPSGEYWLAIGNDTVGFANGWQARAIVGVPLQNQCNSVLYIRVQPPDVPFCDPDLNWDGNADQDDVAFLIELIASVGEMTECGYDPLVKADPDYNRDGTADFGDVMALVDVIAGGGCP